MAAPVSQDLRRRLVQAVEADSPAREAAQQFAVSEAGPIEPIRRVRETGSTRPARIGGYRKPLLAGHELPLRELTETRSTIALPKIKAELAARVIEAGCLSAIGPTDTSSRKAGLI